MTTELTNEQLQALLQSPDLAEKLVELGGGAVQQFSRVATEAVQAQKEKVAEAHRQKVEAYINQIERGLESKGINRDEFAVAIAARFNLSVKSTRSTSSRSSGAKRQNAPTRPKYKIVVDGKDKVWTGKGRAPEAFKAAKEAGELEQYRMTEKEVQAHMQADPEKYGS
ncbi:TPA: H-NS histone family protein [Vibrio parahaemolyticus]|nr:H-NS histone family protein [Vibrio parahaemolyticus]HCG5287110.1 H-NS histone family protein [Vibrio parahaemolyticus]